VAIKVNTVGLSANKFLPVSRKMSAGVGRDDMEVYHESKTVCKTDVRKVQNYPPQGQGNGYMQQSQA